MILSFSPHPSPLLSLPTTSTSKPRARLRPVHASASASPSPELLGKSALRRISDKLRSLGYIETTPEAPALDPSPGASTAAGPSSPGEIFVPTPAQLLRHRVGCTLDPSWATGDGEASSAARRQRRGRGKDAASAPPSAAELALPRDELRRLQGIGIKVRKRLKVGKAGITEGIVNGIHERWRNAEVVKIRCEDVWAMNMRRTHEILEVSAPLMDGVLDEESSEQSSSGDEDEDLGIESVALSNSAEADETGVPPKLTDREMTILRRLAHPLPFHYALGRSSNLQGLAASMIKLWERCEVAKIAIKRDAHNTDSELITEELKGLTGGTLLSRDKESIVLYRGKDFLPPAVSLAIEHRRKMGSSTIYNPKSNTEESAPATDASVLKVSSDVSVHIHEKEASVFDSTAEPLNTVAQNVEARLSQAIAEKEKAEKLLEELENASQPSKAETREVISEEERYMLRKVGLKMKQFLLLGRRGVFDGTIENMHLHWKYRELVKIICKEHSLKDVEYAAQTLEAESGGILVAVEKVSKGYAIIVYRGKNYQRPSTLRPKSLLSKRDALKRSLQNQRCKEVPEVAPLSLEPEIECASDEMDRALNFTKSEVPLGDDDMQSNAYLNKHEDGSSVTASPCLIETSNDQNRHVSLAVDVDELMLQQNQQSSTVTCGPDSHSGGDSKDVDAPKFDVESDPLLPSRATPLSNQERLVLRKQALKMRKKPVLSIGRNNVITGVAKTIKTHFKKHPLAIVNIKNRADGTPIQQLITELEEATGSVLVSRETNKVILYRGWGAEVAQNSSMENHADKEKEVISPQLLEAIRLECGLLPGESG
nr:unnamed protein product [Digitaria exilis]